MSATRCSVYLIYRIAVINRARIQFCRKSAGKLQSGFEKAKGKIKFGLKKVAIFCFPKK